jgi:hypothetical protein
MKKLTINEISKYSKLSDRWLKERVRKLKPEHPDLIYGGGKPGSNNKYWIDISLIDKITTRKNKSKSTLQKKMTDKQRKELYYEWFRCIEWDYFCCYNPQNELDKISFLEKVKDSGISIFYAIHWTLKSKKEKTSENQSHIHFVFKIVNQDFKIEHYRQKWNNNDDFKIVPFDSKRIQECYEYFVNRKKYKGGNQICYNFGVLPIIT